MHISDGELRALMDGELSPESQKTISGHLEQCTRCSERYAAIRERASLVEREINGLMADGVKSPLSTEAARLRLSVRVQAHKENKSMWRQIFARRYRMAWVGASLILVIALLVSFPSGRALAGRFLSLFRVQKVQVVSVDPKAVEQQLGRLRSSSQLEKLLSDNVQVEHQGVREEVPDPLEASRKAGITVRIPQAAQGPVKWVVKPAARVTMDIDLARIQDLLAEVGKEELSLPAELDGAQVSVSIPPSVVAMFGDCGSTSDARHPEEYDRSTFVWRPCTVFMQMLTPTVAAPQGIDIDQVAESMLQLLGMTPEEARTLSETVDWATTLVIPIPRNLNTAETVQVDGVTGTLVTSQLRGTNRYMLMWIKGEIVYTLSGPGDREKALQLAASLS